MRNSAMWVMCRDLRCWETEARRFQVQVPTVSIVSPQRKKGACRYKIIFTRKVELTNKYK